MGARTGKYKLGVSAGKYKYGARAGKYKLGPELGDKQRARGQEIQALLLFEKNLKC